MVWLDEVGVSVYPKAGEKAVVEEERVERAAMVYFPFYLSYTELVKLSQGCGDVFQVLCCSSVMSTIADSIIEA